MSVVEVPYLNGSVDDSILRVNNGGHRPITFEGDPRMRPCSAYRIMLENTDAKKWVRSGLTAILRDGLNSIPEGAVVFSPSMDTMVSFCSKIRRRANLIHFTDGSRYDRANCWVLCGRKVTTNKYRLRYEEEPIVQDTNTTQTELLRVDNHECPVCYGDMREAGVLVSCSNQHQVCRSCFRSICSIAQTTYTPAKCPTCRDRYQQSVIDFHFNTSTTSRRTRREIGFLTAYEGNDMDADATFISHFITLVRSYFSTSGLSADTQFFCDTLFHYGGRTHRPILVIDPVTNMRVADFNPQENDDGFNEFVTYLLSDENVERLSKVKIEVGNAEYSEEMYLTDLTTEFGNEAMAKAREFAGNDKLKKMKRREMYIKQWRNLPRDRHRIAFCNQVRRYFCSGGNPSELFNHKELDIPYNDVTNAKYGIHRYW